MRICLLNDSFPPMLDGVANVVLNYGSILQAQEENEVVVGTPLYPEMDYSVFPFQVIPYQSQKTPDSVGGYRFGMPLDVKTAKAIAAFQPDIIHVHSPLSALYIARLVRNFCGAPIITTYHTKFDIEIERIFKGKMLQKQAAQIIVENIHASDVVWTVSDGAEENLHRLGYKGECTVMRNGVDFPKRISSQEEIEAATKGFDLPEGVPLFIYVGRLMGYKGLRLIMEALGQLSQKQIDFRMAVIGEGPEEKELKMIAHECGMAVEAADEKEKPSHVYVTGHTPMEDAAQESRITQLHPNKEGCTGKVIFTGEITNRNELRAWNSRADLLLFPSTFDTSGLVVREAAACGLAGIYVKDSCVAEGITDGLDGFLIEETSDSLAQKLEQILGEQIPVKEIGKNAMENLYVSWTDCIDDAYEKYKEIIRLNQEGAFAARKSTLASTIIDIAANAGNIFTAGIKDTKK